MIGNAGAGVRSPFVRAWWLLPVLGLIALGAPEASAQNITKGRVIGSVLTAAGNPMWDARVILTDTATGVERVLTTSIDGQYAFSLLTPGDYELRFEKIGYQPKRLVVPVRPRRTVMIPPVMLPLVPLPVEEIVEERFATGAAAASRIGTGQWISGSFAGSVPGDRRTLADLSRFSAFADRDFQIAGLPAGESTFLVEGIGVGGVRHPDLGRQQQLGAVLPQSGFDGAELIFNPIDVEFGDVAGALAMAYPRRGSREFAVTGYADVSGDPLANASGFDVPKHTSGRGAITLGGPIVRDTTHFAVGLEWVRTEEPRPRAWQASAADAALLAVAQDSFGVDLGPFTRPSVARTNVISGFGRIDALLGAATTANLTAGAAIIRDTDVDLGPDYAASLGSTVDGVDVMAVGTVASGRSGEIQQEFRVGFESSEREYDASGLPTTTILEDAIRFGFDRTLPGTFRRTSVSFNEVLFGDFGRNSAKLGVGGVISSHDRTYAASSGGSFLFGDVAGFAGNRGVFSQGVGTPGNASYSSSRFFGYVQDTWIPSGRVQISFGMRVDLSWLPTNRLGINSDWFERTGVASDGTVFTLDSTGTITSDLKRARWRFSPRVGLAWDLGPNREWTLNGGLGLYVGELDPGVFSDLMVRDGVFEVRGGQGVLGGWPGVPDSTVAPVLGPSLAVIQPDFEAPRTFSVSLGLARDLGANTAFYVAGVYRHVDFLPRIQDLNRPADPTAQDQHDRAIWGRLVQQGPLLATIPGSNRRFTAFDRVTAVSPDGYSDYVAVTLGIDRQMGRGLRLTGQYTFSRTTDNWLGAGIGGIDRQLSPFPGSPDRTWVEGTGDLDVPHRVVAAVILRPERLPVEVAAYYRFASGRPFTPGYPDGVDVNGDGSGFNDPAFIDPNLPGMDALLANPCLSLQRGQFADRNSCRGPGAHQLDVRLAVPVVRSGRLPVSLVVDGINLIASRTGLIDRAVYRIDPAGAVTTSSDGSRITVPLVVNPGFGQFAVRTDRGRFVRVGARVGAR